MAGLLDVPGMFGNLYSDPSSAGVVGTAAGLLQASGPSRFPISTGQALSGGLLSGFNMYQEAEQARRRSALLNAQTHNVTLGNEATVRANEAMEAMAQRLPPDQAAQFRANPQAFIKSMTEGFTLSPGQTRYQGGQPLANLPKTDFLNLGDRQLAVDPAAVAPGTSFEVGVSPTTRFVEGQVNERYNRPSGTATFNQGQLNRRHQTPGATSAPGVYRLPDGSSISHAQMMQQYKVENNLMDTVDLSILSKADPVRAQREREKIQNARPFPNWARGRFGIDVSGGFTPIPAPNLPPQARPQPQPSPGGEREERRTLGGKSYVKINGQWYEE